MTVLNSLPHLIPWPYIIYNKAGLILYTNHAFSNLFIKPISVGESLENIFVKLDHRPTHHWTGISEVRKGLLKTDDYSWNIMIKSDEKKSKQFWLFVCSDQNSALEKAQQSLKQKSLFIANVCHEIRNTLNTIQNLCEVSLEDSQDQKNQTLNKILDCSQELKNLVHDVLDFSSHEMGEVVLEKTPFDPVQVFEETVTQSYSTTQRKHIELVALACPQSPRSVIGDSMKFRRVIINLLSNAIKFTEAGFVHCYLNFRAENSHYIASIIVEDSGIGITPEQCRKIFEPFTQADCSTRRRFGGYGLGLSIVKDLTKAMQGNIQVQSKINTGSTFIATIQLDANPQQEFLNRIDLTHMKVLLLGGQCEVQNWLVRYFNHSQASVVLAENNKEAEKIWHQSMDKSEPFTHVIIDLPQDTSPQLSLIPLEKIILIADRELHLRDIKQIPKPLTLSSLNNYFGSSLKAKSQTQKNTNTQNLGKPLKILIAEDNQVNREVTTRRLRGAGHDVTAAVDGLAALELWRSKDFDLVLIDLQMPLLDGINLIKFIREEELKFKRRPTKLVALTGMNLQKENDFQLNQLGLDDFFLKPIRGAELIRRINHLFKSENQEPELDEFHTALSKADEEEIEDLKCAAHIFLRHSETVIQQFEQVMLSNHPESIIKECHSLKGMLALMSCPTLSHLAGQLEENPVGPQALDNGKKLSNGLHKLRESLRISSVLTPHG